MGKYLSIVLGIAAMVIGVVLLIDWWYELLFLFRGTFPILLVIGGAVALFAGLAELKDTLAKHN